MATEMAWRGDFIGGTFVKTKESQGEVLSKNPGDLDAPAVRFPFGYDHVPQAVSAARNAFTRWRHIPNSDRYSAVSRYRDILAKNSQRIAFSLSVEGGKPLWESQLEVKETLDLIEFFLKLAPQTGREIEVPLDSLGGITGAYRYFPLGPLAAITPSTQPLYYSHSHIIPALLSGNTVVMKSSKFNPITGQIVAEVANDAQLPPGVFNLLHGNEEVARRLITSNDIQGVFFTGSHEKGLHIRKELLNDYWKQLVLQAGGKNTMILWDDCHYEKALQDSLYACFVTSGQRYTSARRLVVHDSLFDKFQNDLHALAKKVSIGYGAQQSDHPPFMGPLVSEAKMENYLRYQGIAVREGCEEIMRGKTIEKDRRGYYVSPSIHSVPGINAKSAYQKEEIFGPNVALYRASRLEEAIDIANFRSYGLVHAVYTQNKDVYSQLVAEVRCGLLHWNRPTTTTCFRLPVGGVGMSGNHRPMGSLAAFQCTYPSSSVMEPAGLRAECPPGVLPAL